MFNHLANKILENINISYRKIIVMLNHKLSNFLKAARYIFSMKDGSSYNFYLPHLRKNLQCMSIKIIPTFLYDHFASINYTFYHSHNSSKNNGRQNTLNYSNQKLFYFIKKIENIWCKIKKILHPNLHKHESMTNSLSKLLSHYVQLFLPLLLH
jgi:hypothetical protein